MLRSGGAVILMRNANLKYLAGNSIEYVKPVAIFDELVCDFLDQLSKTIRNDVRAKQYPDVLSFAFFCRKANVQRIKKKYENDGVRMGRGLVFHIAPSNVPVNFAFTYVFGLLSGNANIVRVSNKHFTQTDIICDAINELFQLEGYKRIYNQTAIVQYEHSQEVTDLLSAMADVRVIWGGNHTIEEIKKSPVQTRCVEIVFADRYSIGVMNSDVIMQISEKELKKLASDFYNDTYLMDQNACSTPHLIWWLGEDEHKKAAQRRFWNAVFECAGKYDFPDIKASDKYVMLCKYVMNNSGLSVDRWENLLYVISLKELPEEITGLRGQYGLFFQYNIESLDELVVHVKKNVQSCLYYGIDSDDIKQMVIDNGIPGIDRVVEFGHGLDIGVIWDGYDLVREMSRIIGD